MKKTKMEGEKNGKEGSGQQAGHPSKTEEVSCREIIFKNRCLKSVELLVMCVWWGDFYK